MGAAPVFRSLLAPKLIFGLPYELGMGIGLVSLYLVLLLGFWVLPAVLVAFFALRLTISLDPFALRIYKLYCREADVYVPAVTTLMGRSDRRAGTGCGRLC